MKSLITMFRILSSFFRKKAHLLHPIAVRPARLSAVKSTGINMAESGLRITSFCEHWPSRIDITLLTEKESGSENGSAIRNDRIDSVVRTSQLCEGIVA